MVVFIDFASKTAFSNCKNSRKSRREKVRFLQKKTHFLKIILFFEKSKGRARPARPYPFKI